MLPRCLQYIFLLVPVIHALAPSPGLSPDPGSMSRVIFNEFSNLTEEQALIMAFNYTTTLFMADKYVYMLNDILD